MKYAILAFLVFLIYRWFSEKPRISESRRKELHDQEPDDPDYADYEEID
jgi:hypothetical protein